MELIHIAECVLVFLTWTFVLYWIHRVGHKIPFVNRFHQDHHLYINRKGGTTWHWNNLFLYNDTWMSTIDLWITEVIPTIIFSAITGYWWVFVFYYLWAALLQEIIEHNPKFDWYPFLTSGKWHLVHHRNQRRNFGLFVPLWDILFGTYKSHAEIK
jgi:sterol desaturase/sphingolipid hydroxylase (fatty acid hydroxylase superfamily)